MSSNPVYLGSEGALEGLGQTASAAGAAKNNKKTLKITAIQKWKICQVPELVQYRNKGTHSGTGMPVLD
jgi:hypothetical protein